MKQYPLYFQPLSNGEVLAYRKCGAGEKNLVLIHGNMSSSVHFQVLMEQLESRYTIHAVDLRGFGDSTYHHPFDSLKELGEDIKEFLSLRKIEKPALLGWSTGGGAAMEIAADWGDAVRGILLLNSVAVNGYIINRKDENGAPIPGQLLVTREEIAADPVQVAPPLKAFETQDREYFRYLWNLVIYNQKQPDPADYELYLDAILKERCLLDVDYSLVHFNMTEVSNGAEPGSGRGRKITCPVTIIHGENDMVVPVQTAREAKEFFGDRAELVIMKGAGHSMVTDDLPALAEAVGSRV